MHLDARRACKARLASLRVPAAPRSARAARHGVAGRRALPLRPPRLLEQAVGDDARRSVQGHAVRAHAMGVGPASRAGGVWGRLVRAGRQAQCGWLVSPPSPLHPHPLPTTPPCFETLPAAPSTSARTCLLGTTTCSARGRSSLRSTSGGGLAGDDGGGGWAMIGCGCWGCRRLRAVQVQAVAARTCPMRHPTTAAAALAYAQRGQGTRHGL